MAAIHDLLGDEQKMAMLQELVEIGSSIATVEAKLGMPPGRLSAWLVKGKEKARTPYRQLYIKYRSYAAEARATAEAQQLAKNPGAWLDRNTSAKVVEPDTPSSGTGLLPAPQAQTNDLRLGANALLSALAALQQSGVDINEALRKNQIQAALPTPKESESDE